MKKQDIKMKPDILPSRSERRAQKKNVKQPKQVRVVFSHFNPSVMGVSDRGQRECYEFIEAVDLEPMCNDKACNKATQKVVNEIFEYVAKDPNNKVEVILCPEK